MSTPPEHLPAKKLTAVAEVLISLQPAPKVAPKTVPPLQAQAAVTLPVQPASQQGVTPVVDPQPGEYATRRDAAQLLLTALLTHRQAAHVAGETAAATAALLQGKTHADALQWPLALAEVEKARKACADGKGFADTHQTYVNGPRRDANNAIAAATAAGVAAGPFQASLNAADLKAAPPGRNHGGATTDAEKVCTDIGVALTAKYITPVQGPLATHKTSAQKAFLKPLTDELDTLVAQLQQFIIAKAYGQLRLSKVRIDRLLTNADKMSPRRALFDAQRPKTVAEMAKLKPVVMLAKPLAALDQRLAAADQQASFEAQHMDDAERELKAMAEECKACLDLRAEAVKYTVERGERATEMTALDKHKAAAEIAPEREAVRKLLAEAVAAAGDAGPPGAGLVVEVDRSKHDIARAMQLLAQVKSDQALASQLAAGLGGLVKAQAAVGDTPTADSLNQGVKALKAELAAARKDAHADLSTQEFGLTQAGIAQCEQHIKAAELPLAGQALTAAGVQLAAGRRLQVEHARFADVHKALTARHATLLLTPEALKIKPALDPFKLALDNAAAQDSAGDFVKALGLLRGAEAEAAKADDALARRKAFDSREAATRLALNDANFAAIKTAQLGRVDAALAQANTLGFAAAAKTLDGVDAAMASADVIRLAQANPSDAALLQRAKDVKKSGGDAALDQLIADLPLSVTKEVFTKLAKERFGVDVMSTDPDSQAPQQALKQMCKLFAGVPDVVLNNPSLKKVQHTNSGGASYASDGSLVKMNDRPAPNSKADFKKDSSGNLPSNRLPADREEACKPANDNPEDLFDFNSLHELAHSIDDANNFMGSRLGAGNTEFAGWVIHAGNVQPIADAVAAELGYNLNAEQVRYVLDKIVGNPLVIPLDDSGAEPVPWKAARDKVDLWHAGATSQPWSSQAKAMAVNIGGRIYQEAYDGRWMSYQTAARRRGITAYQFRAPGEWFSELYAAFKLKKLKSGHPSEDWLSKLSV